MPRTVKRCRPKQSWTGTKLGWGVFDLDPGESSAYAMTLLDTGQYSGTFDFEVCAKLKDTLAFVAINRRITDSASGLAHIKTGDILRVVGSVSNDGIYNVATGAQAAYCTLTQSVVDELAGAWVQLHKRATISQNCVYDRRTGLIWSKTPIPTTLGQPSLFSFISSNANSFVRAHAADGNVSFDASTRTFRIVGGAAEVVKYRVGMTIGATGFTNPHTNLWGYTISAVSVDGADLVIQIRDLGQTKVTEAAGGSRSLAVGMISAQGVLSWMNQFSFAGHSDWRLPGAQELMSLFDHSLLYGTPSLFATLNGFQFFTSTPSKSPTGRLIVMSFDTAGPAFSTHVPASNGSYILPVRGRS